MKRRVITTDNYNILIFLNFYFMDSGLKGGRVDGGDRRLKVISHKEVMLT